jgi:O-antigen ligase
MLSIPNNRLVGTGYDSFWLGSRLKTLWKAFPNLPIGQAHDGYLELFLNLGWIGVALLGLLIATGYRNATGGYRRDPDIGGLRMAFIVAVLITGFTEGVFRMMTLTWIFLLLATARAPWMPRRRGAAVVTSTQDLPESGQEPDAVREGAPVGY